MPRKRARLDEMLVQHGLALNLKEARALIMGKAVMVNETYLDKAGVLVDVDAQIKIKGHDHPFVSRGGLKLKGALEEFKLDVGGLVALDVGASTGGFTDCLLQAGARKVYALDVGYGQLAWKLRADKRIVVMERRNIRYCDGSDMAEKPDIATIDVSFISLKTVLPAVLKLLAAEGIILALIKPQFEARREEVGKQGVVRDLLVRQRVVEEIINFCRSLHLQVNGTCVSPLSGPEGNQEFFIFARKIKQNGD